jgi:hypothetical protein
MKPGRNDPCPCGSGRKYKHCCLSLNESPITDLTEHAWKRMREAIKSYAPALLDFTLTTYGAEALHEAWFEFTLGSDEEFSNNHPEAMLFIPWFFHRWTPAAAKGNTIVEANLQGVPPTSAYLARKARHLNPLLQRYLEACLAAPFGFHEVLSCEPQVGFTARDVVQGKELRVRDQAASSMLMKGDILYGQLVQLQGFAMLEASAPFAFPPAYKTHLIQMRHRQELRIEPDAALRTLYRTLAEGYLNPRPPELHNTDGDVLEPRTLYYDIASAQEAFDALKALALNVSEDELREDAKSGPDGTLLEATIPWMRPASPNHSAMQTVVAGQIRITGRKMTVDVNSMERARAARALITEKLGTRARYLRTRKQPMEAALRAPKGLAAGSGPQLVPRDAEQEALMQQPEVRAHIEAMQRRHYESWPDIPLPALNGKTPLEAMKTADGREMVDALVTQFERDAGQHGIGVSVDVLAELRRRLGM